MEIRKRAPAPFCLGLVFYHKLTITILVITILVTQVIFGPPVDVNPNSVMVSTVDRQLFTFGPEKDETLEKQFGEMVQVI
jgi:hypothetical protein